jgi:hypothetical protein
VMAKKAMKDTRRNVASTMERLRGATRSDVEPDARRGAMSGLGGGSPADKEKLRKSLVLRGRKDAR